MSKIRTGVFGTNEQAIAATETEVGFRFPPSFRAWLIQNNGLQLAGIRTIYPVYDERAPVRTSKSLTRNYRDGWAQWLAVFADDYQPPNFDHLFPFAECANGDYYCFDYSRLRIDKETPVVLWSHDTGGTEDRAANFNEFVEKARNGEYNSD